MITFIKIWIVLCAVNFLTWAWCILRAKANPRKFKLRMILGNAYISEYISVFLSIFCAGAGLWILVWFLFFK